MHIEGWHPHYRRQGVSFLRTSRPVGLADLPGMCLTKVKGNSSGSLSNGFGPCPVEVLATLSFLYV
jgi:hypothetical protein